MEETDREHLRKRILEELVINYSVLEQNLNLAKGLIGLAENGEVDVKIREKLTGPDKILLYLVGKLYAKEAGLATTDEVGNSEFMEKLAIPSGSLLPWLKTLRDENRIRQTERDRYTYHSIPISQVEKTLTEIAQKIYHREPQETGQPSTTAQASLPESLAEFVKSKGNPSKHGVLVVIFGYWIFNKLKRDAFTTKDIKECYSDARIHESSNTSAYLNGAQSEGYFMRLDKKKDNHVAWTITQTGEKFVHEEQWKTSE